MEKEPLEKELKDFEKCGSSYFDNEDYLACKRKLDKIWDKKVEGIRIRSKYKFFLTLEKRHAIQNRMKILVINDEVLKEQTEINKNLYSFIKSFFPKITKFLEKRYCNDNQCALYCNDNQCALWGKDITEEEVKKRIE